MRNGKRTFTVSSALHVDGCPTKFKNKDYSGIYVSTTPAGAAKKAMTQLCRVKRISGACSLFITVRETTREATNKKEFVYKLQRQKRKEPVVLGDRTYEYKTVSKKATNIPKCSGTRKQSSGRKASSKRRTRTLRR